MADTDLTWGQRPRLAPGFSVWLNLRGLARLERTQMTRPTIKAGTTGEFFERGRALGRRLDANEPTFGGPIISFEDPADLLKVATDTRLALFRAIKQTPG